MKVASLDFELLKFHRFWKCSAKIEKVLSSVSLCFALFIFVKLWAVVSLVLTKSGLDNVNNGLACIDVGEDLATAWGILGSLLEDNDLRLLYDKKSRVSQWSSSECFIVFALDKNCYFQVSIKRHYRQVTLEYDEANLLLNCSYTSDSKRIDSLNCRYE